MPAYYIACDAVPVENTGGTRLQCNYTAGAISLTEQEVIDSYYPPIDVENAHFIGMKLFVAWLLIYSAKKISQTMRFF